MPGGTNEPCASRGSQTTALIRSVSVDAFKSWTTPPSVVFFHDLLFTCNQTGEPRSLGS